MSQITQEALQARRAARRLSSWLDDVLALPSTGIDDDRVVEAVAAARDDMGLRG